MAVRRQRVNSRGWSDRILTAGTPNIYDSESPLRGPFEVLVNFRTVTLLPRLMPHVHYAQVVLTVEPGGGASAAPGDSMNILNKIKIFAQQFF